MRKFKLIFIEFILVFSILSCSDIWNKSTVSNEESYCMEQTQNKFDEELQETISDNSNFSLNFKKSDKQSQVDCNYIGNRNTKKLHYPNCVSVGTMNDKNKDYLYCTLDEAIEKGYIPCNNCKP